MFRGNHYILLLTLTLEALIILAIALSVHHGFPWSTIGYNLIYGLLLSTALPLVYIYRRRESLASLGIKRPDLRDVVVLVLFVGFSVGGRMVQVNGGGQSIPFGLLPAAILPLLMTTFFEEFLFRGFMQTRFEKAYGAIPAVILSGLFFSLYHIGYPGFRNLEGLVLLFAVGLGFALAYKLSGNNLLVVYMVNLPHAFLTYLLKWEQFPNLHAFTANAAAALSIVLVVVIFVVYGRKAKNNPPYNDGL